MFRIFVFIRTYLLQDFLEKKPISSKHKLGNTVTKTPEFLRLLPHNQNLSPCFDEGKRTNSKKEVLYTRRLL